MSAVKVIPGTAEALTYAATLTAEKSSDHLSFEARPNHHAIVSNTCFTGSEV
jgi:bifunctional DNase/RNase